MSVTLDYPIGVKKEIVSAIKPLFGEAYPDEDMRNKIQVHLEWPLARTQYPSIFLTYTEGPVETMGVGHTEYATDDFGVPFEVRHYKFSGQINFNVLSLSPLERDRVAAGLMNLLAFGDTIPAFEDFKDEIADGDYVRLVILTDRITPQGQHTDPVPWGNEDEMIYSQTYSVEVFGEMYSEPSTASLVKISAVEVYPYYTGDLPPF